MQDENISSTGAKLIHFQGNLRKYNAKRKFKGAIEGVMMANMLKRMLQVRRSSTMEQGGQEVVLANEVTKQVEGEGAEGGDMKKVTEAPKAKGDGGVSGARGVEGDEVEVSGGGDNEAGVGGAGGGDGGGAEDGSS